MDYRSLIATVIYCFLVGCSVPLNRSSDVELQAQGYMHRAAAFEYAREYNQAAKEYALVAERFSSTSYHKAAVRKAALLNIHPSNSEIDPKAAMHWLKIYLTLPLSPEEKEDAQFHMAMLKDINRLQAEIARQKADNQTLRTGTLEQSAKITADTQRIKELEAELAQLREQLEEMKEVDLRMHTERVNGSNGGLVKLTKKSRDTHPGSDFLKTSAATYPEPAESEDLNKVPPTSSEDTSPQTREAYPYAIQISSYSIKKDAVHAAKEARKKGDAGFSSHARISDKGDWYRVYIGFYRTFDEAKKAALELKNRNYPNAFVVKMPFAIRIEVPVSEKALEKLETDLENKGYLTYEVPGEKSHDKNTLLIGGFETKKAALNHIKIFQDAGLNPKVVRR